MPILSAAGHEVDDQWQFVSEMPQSLSQDHIVVSVEHLAPFIATPGGDQHRKVGVRLHIDDDIEDIADDLQSIDLIEFVFPHFKDGRRYSTALELRRKYGYSGDLRASGDILPDQALFLVRSGFTTIAVPEQFSVEQFKSSLSAYSVAYQADYNQTPRLIIGLRRGDAKVAAQ